MEPATPDTRAWLAQLQLLDSALPVGTFAHSFGLETAVDDGAVHDVASLRGYLSAMLHGRWAPIDALVATAPFELVGGLELARLVDAVHVVHLSIPSSRSRTAQLAIGRRLLQLLPELFPDVDLDDLHAAVTEHGIPTLHPLVHGWALWRLGATRDHVAVGWLHAAVTSCVGAAVRLMALGQTDAQRLVAQLAAELPDAWAATRDRSVVDAAGFGPVADEWAMRQPRLEGRMFMS